MNPHPHFALTTLAAALLLAGCAGPEVAPNYDARFGQSVRQAIESWDSNKRVALLASGGLSHVVIDEEIDAMVIDGLKNKKPEVLFQLPRKKLTGGTSEILNWVALAGAMEDRELKYLEYVTTYRSPAATGCGMGFAYWL